ncbi:CTP synthase [Chitinispirillum alkaliphilum]|nr:CTP synthase [Chitinispirillum alkaliphilum]
MTKHIFVTGGVVSSLGKGITAASVALLLQRRGYTVRLQKLDPYLNVDPGTMSPYQHGEVFVTCDGAETDLDLGHYERFTGVPCTRASNYTTGRIYSSVIAREREGGYFGKTVQVIPHITDEIKEALHAFDSEDVDIVITEIGGTVGDIESLPFLEAIRQFRLEIGRANGLFMHLTLVPYIRAAGEMKTKPTQQSVGMLRTIGIIPDMLICRCERSISDELKEKLAMFCNVDSDLVIEEKDVKHSIYEVPLDLAEQELDVHCLELLNLHVNRIRIDDWESMVKNLIAPGKPSVEIAVVGKYISLQDAYKSIYEALRHGGIANNVEVKIRMVESEEIEKSGAESLLSQTQGVLVPGGFGDRGIEGKIDAIRYARENRIPFLGICLGMQCGVIEFARNVCEMSGAGSTEFEKELTFPVIDLMETQKEVKGLGGTMRLGAYDCVVREGTKAYSAYGTENIQERHRHRYEFNNSFRDQMSSKGMVFSGLSPDGSLVEIVELADHPWFVMCQFHPEFQSTPLMPHPLFRDFIASAVKESEQLEIKEFGLSK